MTTNEESKPFLITNSSQTSDKQVQTHFNNAAVSPWLQTDADASSNPLNQESNQEPFVKHVSRQIPVRSVSTVSFRDQKDGAHIRAAPFPSLPSRRDVQEIKISVEQEIQRIRADLSSLQHERNSFNRTTNPNLIPSSTTNGIREYRGLLISENSINSVIAENRAKKAESEKTRNLTNNVQLFKHSVEFPMYQQIIASQKNSIVPLFAAQFSEKKAIMEAQKALAEKYVHLKEVWKEPNRLIDEYGSRVDVKSEQWPAEFTMDTPKIDDAMRLKWCAPDREMFLSNNQKIADCYYNTNGIVHDPVSAHNEYRTRLCWTDEEKQTFVEKYRQYPKDFTKIAAALPEKCHKDVIEFYYLKKYELCLKENEGAMKKRGGKRKVISEGSAKKNY
ncbi:Myb-like DNA-binding domain containing protein [Tritrichomonas foetus]|uniref:Myb-like DNA-binding domain containing protein n=1 Tax=Tritrichomonas foetus TaxID=1144522 RepID=A0A1J4JZF9_9EUKA|nr:Myb-like DNA-binding domain containing protein [Tritrichomonas foetus]|eukprot:OHT04074.1 Myb-like DNA-binding domain containing protein [Tritrichomonas foetus]